MKTKAALYFLALALLCMPRWFMGEVYLPGKVLLSCYPWRYAACGLTIGETPRDNPLLYDCMEVYQPHDVQYARALKQGHMLLWDSTTYCGYPLYAEGQSAHFYPPKMLLCWLLPDEVAHNAYVALHMWGAGFFAYLFMLRLTRRPIAALLGGTVWMLSGALIVRMEMKPYVVFGALLPALLLAVDVLVERPRPRSASLTAVATALVLMGGSLQFSWYCLLLAGAYFLYRARTWPTAACMLAAQAMAFLLAAPTLLPTWQLFSLCERPSYSFTELFADNRLYVENLLTFLVPGLLGGPRFDFYLTRVASDLQSPLELSGHLGMVGTCCALAAVLSWRSQRHVVFFAASAVVCVLFVMGTPLFWIPYLLVPGFKHFTVSRLLFVYCFCGSTLAALGLDAMLAAEAPLRRRLSAWLWVPGAVAATAVGGAPLLLGGRSTLLEYYANHGVLLAYLPNYMPMGRYQNAVRANVAAYYQVGNPHLLIAVMCGLGGAALLCWWLRGGPQPLKVGVLALAALDLLWFGWMWNPSVPFGSTYPRFASEPLLQQAQRVAGVIAVAHPNLLSPYGVRDVAGYDGAFPGQYKRFMEAWQGQTAQFYTVMYVRRMGPRFRAWANLLGVDCIYTDPLTQLPGFEEADRAKTADLTVYHNRQALPRASLVGAWRRDDQPLQTMSSPAFDAAAVTLLDTEVAGSGPSSPAGTASIVPESADEVRVQVDATRSALLVLRDQYYPGWRCTVDGVEEPIYRADGILRAVAVTAGHHLVRFWFAPPLLVVGCWLCVTGAVLALWAWGRR